MKNLYIDFDGVILDTIEALYSYASNNKLDIKDPKFYEEFEWETILTDELISNDSINCINKLIESNKFRINILTHIFSLKEGILKTRYIRKHFNDVSVILVPKELSKTEIVNPKDSILVDDYSGNLKEWEDKNGISIRFSKTNESKGFKVVNKLDQLLEIF